MFFEDEDKDQSKHMDNYDLEFPDDNSISWDKLLDEAEAEQIPKKPTEDDLLTEDEESFDNLLASQELHIDADEPLDIADDTEISFDHDINILDEIQQSEPEIKEDLNIETETEAEAETDFVIPDIQNVNDEISVNDMLEDLNKPEHDMGEIVQEQLAEPQEAIELDEPISNENKTLTEIEPESVTIAPTFEPTSSEAEEIQDGAPEEKPQEESKNERTPISAPKKEKDMAVIWGVVVAVALVVAIIAGVSWYLTIQGKGQDVATGDFTSLLNNDNQDKANQDAAQQDMPTPPEPPAQPDIASQNVAQDSAQNGINKPIAPKTVDKKAATKKPSTQKVTLTVANTGRINPFAPAGNFNKFGFMTAPKVDILEPPTQLGNLSGDLDRLAKITVSGILYDSMKPSAIINVDGVDYFVQKYDRVDDFTVAAISRDTVVIKKGNNVYRATIGENFHNGAIAGAVPRTPARQYISVSDVNINPQ